MLRSAEELLTEPKKLMEGVSMVSMGINPSASDLHLGHYLTMYQFVKAVSASDSDARGLFFIDDREFDLGNPNTGNGKGLFYMQERTQVDAIMKKVIRTLDEYADTMKIPGLRSKMYVRSMSDWMTDTDVSGVRTGQTLYSMLMQNRTQIVAALQPGGLNESVKPFMRPFCPECGTGSRLEHEITLTKNALMSVCRNRDCSHRKKEYVSSPEKGDRNWSMFYAVDPLRDILLSRSSGGKVLHVFGGDYGVPWGVSPYSARGGNHEYSKAYRLTKLVPKIDPLAYVDHYVGPMLVGPDGRKLAKSNGDKTLNVPSPSYLQEILDARRVEVRIA